MKISCEVMQDLLPLYADEVCTVATSELVNEHIAECEACKASLEHMKKIIPSDTQGIEENLDLDENLKKGIKKAKKKTRLTACITTIMVIVLLVLGVNEYFGWGVGFTNMDNIFYAYQFMNCIKNGDYEKAAEMQEESYADAYKEIKVAMEEAMDDEDWEKRKPFYEDVIGVSKQEYVEVRKQEFIAHMEIYEENIDLKSFYINSIYNSVTVKFAIQEEYLETGDVFPCYIEVSAFSKNNIKCIMGGIKIEELERENYEAYDEYDLYDAINDGGAYYDGPIWEE